MSQGQRSRGSWSKVNWGKPGLKAMILAGGLTPTSSCIFDDHDRKAKILISTQKAQEAQSLYTEKAKCAKLKVTHSLKHLSCVGTSFCVESLHILIHGLLE